MGPNTGPEKCQSASLSAAANENHGVYPVCTLFSNYGVLCLSSHLLFLFIYIGRVLSFPLLLSLLKSFHCWLHRYDATYDSWFAFRSNRSRPSKNAFSPIAWGLLPPSFHMTTHIWLLLRRRESKSPRTSVSLAENCGLRKQPTHRNTNIKIQYVRDKR